MTPLLLFALGNLKHDASWAWGKLTHASFWQLTTLGLGLWMVVVQFQLADARHDAAAYLKQRDEYKKQLDSISTKRDVQRQVTRDTLKVVTRTIHDADGRAKQVEEAPPAPDCGTSPQVMGADL